MIRVLLSGCGGRMGRVVDHICEEMEDLSIVVGVDPALPKCSFPVYSAFDQVKEEVDVIIDFSFHSAIGSLLDFAKMNRIPAVIATTGFTQQELDLLDRARHEIPVFRSANMSLGVNLICQLAKKAARFLPDFDIEIIEKHHNQKVDSPSGTALMLADEISSVMPYETSYRFGREGICGKRTKEEIGIHAVRGGSIVGEHDVIFAGLGETVTISHSAGTREILANGAVCAARFLVDRKPGLYSMKDIFED